MNNSQKKAARGDQVNLVDLFFFLLSHWYWFLLCAAIAIVCIFITTVRVS